jgi:hypothetical protein
MTPSGKNLSGIHRFFRFRLNPFVVFLDEVNEPFHRLGFGNVELDRRLADVKINLVRRAAHIAEIRVRHFARPVHDATHDGDLHAFQMFRARFDARRDGLQIKQSSPAARTRDVIRLETAAAGSLQNVVSQPQRHSRAGFTANQNRVTNSVRQ